MSSTTKGINGLFYAGGAQDYVKDHGFFFMKLGRPFVSLPIIRTEARRFLLTTSNDVPKPCR